MNFLKLGVFGRALTITLRGYRLPTFAQLLLANLDEDAEIEEAWAAKVGRRIADVESGTVQVIPIADALAQVRAALK